MTVFNENRIAILDNSLNIRSNSMQLSSTAQIASNKVILGPAVSVWMMLIDSSL